ncbi:hypothetical protein GCM10010149_48880 [Nonomuraea roseoviolacea subsp. roseoviolacea]
MAGPPTVIAWEPHVPRGRTRVTKTCCCGAYEWAAEGGQFLILRRAPSRGREPRPRRVRYEEACRGAYARAYAVWEDLVEGHTCAHVQPAP